MDRAEGGGLVVSILAHAGLVAAAWWLGTHMPPPPSRPGNEPIEVAITDEAGLESQAPQINHDAPQTQMAPVEGPAAPAEAPQPVDTPEPPTKKPDQPKPKLDPNAQPDRNARASNSASNARPGSRAVEPTGRLNNLLNPGLTEQPSPGKSDRPPASAIGSDVKASLAAEVIRQIKPHWRPPSGADSDQLKTTVIVRLAEDGSIVGEPRVEQSGVTPSNAAQAALHKERAIRAVKLAAPFKLPDKFYNAWKIIAPTLYEGL